MNSAKRTWLWFLAIFVVSFVVVNAYWYWRSTTFVPLLSAVRLDVTGFEKSWRVSRFDHVSYHVGLDLDVPFKKTHRWIFDEANRPRIWSDLGATEVEIRIVNEETGKTVLSERGKLSHQNGWILTNSGQAPRANSESGRSVASMYKFTKFEPRRFEAYEVSFRVIKGSPSATNYDPQFFVATVYEYVMLGAVVMNFFLILAFGSAALVMLSLGIARKHGAT